jgi:hydrogenase maturation protease
MNSALVDRIADAVLYEGYILYPYRPSSIKNRQRWNFGGLCPRSYAEVQGGNERSSSQTECLVLAAGAATVRVQLRFLHLVSRQAAELVAAAGGCESVNLRPVETIRIGHRLFQTWQEAFEQRLDLPELSLPPLSHEPRRTSYAFPSAESIEPLRDAAGKLTGAFIRKQQELECAVDVSARRVGDSLYRVTVQVLNLTPMADPHHASRDEAMMFSLVSSHLVLTVDDGAFISLLDPPAEFQNAAAQCKNLGIYPVLVGEEGDRDTILSSPIILYDYPKIAPESPGNLFDGTEIDEILALRILTLTDEEKHEMRDSDERARIILDRVEAHPEQLANLHGVIRSSGPSREETP